MIWVDRIEKVGRVVLWLTLASAVVLVPITYIKQRSAETQLAEAARKEALSEAKRAKDEEAARKPARLTLDSMGTAIRALDTGRARANVWFSNVSARSGFVCVTGVVTNPTTSADTESLSTCKSVEAYASNVEIPLMFAGANLEEVCRGGGCKLTLKEADASK